MFRRLRSLLFASMVIAIPCEALAAFSAQPGARVAFTATGPAGMKIVGNTSELATADDGQNVTITVTLTHLATGIELRDKHMREKYLETPTYPTATLTVPRASLTLPPAGGSQAKDAQGTVTLHGQTRPSPFHYAVVNDNGAYRIDGALHVDMRDFGITVPNYMGLAVKPDVDIDVHFTVVDR